MTDEMLKAKSNAILDKLEEGGFDLDDWSIEDAHNNGFIDGYHEGFKDGAEFGYNKANEWHKADVPTTPINKVVLGYIKDYNTKKFCLVKWNGEWWYDARTWNDKVKLIAWCEIPTFDKE